MTTSDPRRGRRLFWLWFVSVTVLIAGALLFARFVIFIDTATQLTTDEALERYRSSTILATTTTVTAEFRTLPMTGVYRYTTVGRESVDAIDGTEHIYPDETTITFIVAGCGLEMRWDALVERHDEWNLCVTDAGIELQPNGGAYHVFYGDPRPADLGDARQGNPGRHLAGRGDLQGVVHARPGLADPPSMTRLK